MIPANDNQPLRLLRLKDVEAMVGLGRSSIYRKMEEGTFPRQRMLSPSCVRWVESEIVDWIAALPRAA